MEIILVNLSGKTRRETRGGREYIVAPMNILKANGVLNGSKGKLFYPEGEVVNNPGIWNAVPLVVYHPKDEATGNAVSARDPDVLEDHEIGRAFKDEYKDGYRRAEGWFDVKKTEQADRVFARKYPTYVPILPRLEAGEPIELSTGLFTDNSIAPDGSMYNGLEYDGIARNYRPDHIAILPDQKGACSNKDGCGVNNERSILRRIGELLGIVNQSTETLNMARKDDVAYLTANCGCKEKSLEGLSDNELALLKKQSVVANRIGSELMGLTINEACDMTDEELKAEMNSRKTAAKNADMKRKMFEEATEDELKNALKNRKAAASKNGATGDPAHDAKMAGAREAGFDDTESDEDYEKGTSMEGKKVKSKNAAPVGNVQEWLKLQPPEVQNIVNNAMQVEKDEKQRIAGVLTANVKDGDTKRLLTADLLTESLPSLRRKLALVPKTADYGGRGDGPRLLQRPTENELADDAALDLPATH